MATEWQANDLDLRALVIEKTCKYSLSVVFAEDLGIATCLIDDLRIAAINAVDIKAIQSKETRAHLQTPKFQASRVLFPRSAPWLSVLEAELLSIPGGHNDDQTDSIIQALAYEYLTIGSGVRYLRAKFAAIGH